MAEAKVDLGQSRTVWHALCHRGQGYPAVGLLCTPRAPGSGPPGPPKVFVAMEREGCRYLSHLVG